MSEWVDLLANDGNELKAYVARPKGTPKAALVVIQEIFGVNKNIQTTADDWANEGFLAIAPAMFDRFEKNVDLPYDEAGFAAGIALMQKFAPDLQPQTQDVEAAIEWLQSEYEGNIGVVGYCFGGLMAWVSACRLPVQAAVGYYGSSIDKFVNEEPQCPIMLHYGAEDPHIPTAARDKVLQAHPEVPVFVYDNAGHAFNRKLDPIHYNLNAATLAKKRSLLFFEQHLVF